MKIWIDGPYFTVALDDGDDVDLARSLNIPFNPTKNRFEFTRFRTAAGLRRWFDADTDKLFKQMSCNILEPWTGGILIPRGQKLDPYQRHGVLHALERNHSYLAFEQGLGKTPTAAAVVNTYGERAVVLCPPSMIPNWFNELKRWAPKMVVGTPKVNPNGADVLLVPDTMFDRPDYDEVIREHVLDRDCLLVIDEAQRFTIPEAIRTTILYGENPDGNYSKDIEVFGGLVHRFEKVVSLSGTPMRSRPIEMYANLQALAFDRIDYMSKVEYGIRYCGGYEGPFGWNFKGHSNVQAWRKRIHKTYMRREEQDEHLNIDKPEQIIYLKDNRPPRVVEMEDAILEGKPMTEFVDDLLSEKTKQFSNAQLGQIAKYRKELGRLMAKPAIARIKHLLETTKENLLVFCWHDDPVDKILRALQQYHPLVITGVTPSAKRVERVQAFEDGKSRLFIAKILSMVGHNMNRADRCIFVEIGWTPGDNDQAKFRAMRRGKETAVLSEYLCLEGTLSQYVLESNLKKRKVTNAFINKGSI